VTNIPILRQGLIQVFTGEGKGKTTAALGIALRASGRGLKVNIIYILNKNYDTGEQEVLHKLPGVEWAAFGPGLVRNPQKPTIEQKEKASGVIDFAYQKMTSGKYDVIIIDEINVAIHWGWIDINQVLTLIDAKPPNVELILTGRYAHPNIVGKADLVTEMTKVKHPFDKGILARKGIDY
jgi:cob(I)alamin adenosyltransferase